MWGHHCSRGRRGSSLPPSTRTTSPRGLRWAWRLRSHGGPGAPGGGGGAGAEPAPVSGGRSAGALGRSPARAGAVRMSPPSPPALAGTGAERGRPAMAAGSGGAGTAAREHRLEPGDTLPGLALRYGVTVSGYGGTRVGGRGTDIQGSGEAVGWCGAGSPGPVGAGRTPGPPSAPQSPWGHPCPRPLPSPTLSL